MESIEDLTKKAELILVQTFNLSPEHAKAHLLKWQSEQLLREADLALELAKILPPERARTWLLSTSQACDDLAQQLSTG